MVGILRAWIARLPVLTMGFPIKLIEKTGNFSFLGISMLWPGTCYDCNCWMDNPTGGHDGMPLGPVTRAGPSIPERNRWRTGGASEMQIR
jgi:hypothetical protein